ncbi:MAG: DRTGG domain-containing protein [Dehalococcoidia bacterium]
MTVTIVASAEPRAGRSLLAAALAYRLAREGKSVTLVRLSGDDSADSDATAFASLPPMVSPGRPLAADDLRKMAGDVVAEAPPGSVADLAKALDARVVAVGEGEVGVPAAGRVLTRVQAMQVDRARAGEGVIAALAEDRLLASPSAQEIAGKLQARWLHRAGDGGGAFGRVMIGTIASDAAQPYFEGRGRTCVITRFDKTDVQLAALLTDIACLVLTGGGEPSPYLLDRVQGAPDPISVLLAPNDTVETMRSIEGLFGAGRFAGEAKLLRAVELLDGQSAPIQI